MSDEEAAIRYERFVSQLKEPGVYEVGGLGACTLISCHALTAGVNFKPIKNLSFWGEDRHFCVRAAALGFMLFVDTHYPAYHIYRDSDLKGADEFLAEIGKEVIMEYSIEAKSEPLFPTIILNRPTLTLSMVVKNESSRYLTQVLEEHRKYID